MTLQEILEYKIFEAGNYHLTVYKLILLVVIYLVVKLILWSAKKAISRKSKIKKIDQGNEYALLLIVKYIVWILAIVFALETIGIKATILIAGSAALLVGVGLGLQQTFNDIISGIILLVEGSTKVGDIIQINEMVVQVNKIGLRASKVINRDDIIVIIPNSLIVTDMVINWSHQVQETRFKVNVGVAYGSEVDLVIRLLEESAREHELCSKEQLPQARFIDFGDSSLDFEVLFWSNEMFRIEKVRSDIRRTIDRKFRENKITIPFPQRDLHFKSTNIELK